MAMQTAESTQWSLKLNLYKNCLQPSTSVMQQYLLGQLTF